MLKLTRVDTGKVIYVNSRSIVLIEDADAGTGSLVSFANGQMRWVKENPQQICMLRGN